MYFYDPTFVSHLHSSCLEVIKVKAMSYEAEPNVQHSKIVFIIFELETAESKLTRYDLF